MRNFLDLLAEAATTFAPLDKAVAMLENSQEVVSAALTAYMKLEAAKLSVQYPGSYVDLNSGMGSISICIWPSPAIAATIDSDDWDSGAYGDPATDLAVAVSELNDPDHSPFPPFVFNRRLVKEYGLRVWDVGCSAFLDGAEVPVAEMQRYTETLSRSAHNIAHGRG